MNKWFDLFVIGTLISFPILVIGKEEGKIVGGEDVTIAQYPYQISFQYNGQHFCGGSIYSANWIVTAAHCVADFNGNTNGLTIVAGQTKLSATDGQSVAVTQLIQHPQYDAEVVDYDVALLQLAQPLVFNENVQAINLTTTSVKSGSIAIVSGWGTTRRGGGGNLSDQLMAVNVRVQPRFWCQLQYVFQLTRRMFCAGKITGGSDSCQGDSGGPVKFDNELVGIVSFGRGCGDAFSPGVYTDIASIRDFIVSNATSTSTS